MMTNLTDVCQVTLLQHAHSVLTMFTEELQERALAALRQEGVHVLLGVRVVAVTQDQVSACSPFLKPPATRGHRCMSQGSDRDVQLPCSMSVPGVVKIFILEFVFSGT
jgi:phosphoribosylaminoimidazole carboxylase (NCAIR synthetase)